MAKLNVILEVRGRDRGARRQLRELTRLADDFTESAKRASAASSGLGSMGPGPVTSGGRRRGGGGGASSEDRGARRRASRRASSEREFDRAINTALKEQRSIARSLARQDRAQRRAARNIDNLSDEQLVAIELEREQNRRRRRMARQTASTRLGADPTRARRGGGMRGRLEFAENLAVAGGEFEQFGDRVEEGIRGSFNAFKDFEKSVTEVSTLTDDISIDQIREITTGAAEEFGGLPTDQVKAFYSIVSAGATNAADAQAQLEAANKLAIGGVAESEEAVLAISKSVANFGDQGVDAASASDSLFTAVKRGQTTVAEMARALPAVAQAAADTGLSLDETNAAIAVLSTRFPTAKEGATGLRQALSNISKPTEGAREEAEQLGIDFSTAGVQAAGGLEEFLLKLRAADKFDENTLAKLFDSTEARASVSALINGMDDYRSVLEDMESKQGAADEAFAKMSDTSAQKAKKLEAQWELLKISAGEALVPALTDVAEEFGPIIKDVTQWIKDNPRLAGTIAKVAIGVAALSRGVGVFTSGLSMISTLSGLASGDVTRLGSAAKTTGGQLGKMGKFSSVNLAGPFIAATAAIAAFELVLNQAQKPLAKFEQTLEDVEQQQQDISFTDESGQEKSDAQIQLEARNRQVQVLNAAREAARSSRMGGVTDDSNLLEKSIGGYAAILNRTTGVSDDLQAVADQAERDLAAIDARLVSQGVLSEEQAFTVAPTVNPFDAESMQRLLYGIEKIADNTAGGDDPFVGPSMEAGSTS